MKLRYLLLLFLIVFLEKAYGQQILQGSYVATKVSYLSDDELPEEHILKYTYVKYTFTRPDQLNISNLYSDMGRQFAFELKGNRLLVKSPEGSLMNTLRILENDENKLVLIMASQTGAFDSPTSIKYTLYREALIQKNMPLTADDIFSVSARDTVYRAGQKIYAKFNGPSFREYMYDQMRRFDLHGEEFISTYIIDENGQPDSLKIIKGVSQKFDDAYTRAFKATKNRWQAAYLNGKNVKVLMQETLTYLTSEVVLPAYQYSTVANTAFNKEDYQLAMFYYDKALAVKADEVECLFRRGICKQKLGNLSGACGDWKQVKAYGSPIATGLLATYCK
ncbi:MAG: hypothetical protein REI78_02555 [Pedobacter sp.]|nr:hypothetical protein [Pedobacter sp.]MDQ8051873.1 hypothetical protein [Pedobacter sp.]